MTSGPEDEDYRVKNAREGKALYLPGRSVEEVKAEMARERGEGSMITVSLTGEEASRISDSTGEVPFLLSQAANIFSLIAEVTRSGVFDSGDGRVADLLELCGRAFYGAAEKEGAEVEVLGKKIREQLGNHLQKVRDEELQAKADGLAFAERWATQGCRNPDEKEATP